MHEKCDQHTTEMVLALAHRTSPFLPVATGGLESAQYGQGYCRTSKSIPHRQFRLHSKFPPIGLIVDLKTAVESRQNQYELQAQTHQGLDNKDMVDKPAIFLCYHLSKAQ